MKPIPAKPNPITIDDLTPWEPVSEDCTEPETAKQITARLVECEGYPQTCRLALAEQQAIWEAAMGDALSAQEAWLYADSVDAAIASDGRWSPWLVGLVSAAVAIGGTAVGVVLGLLFGSADVVVLD